MRSLWLLLFSMLYVESVMRVDAPLSLIQTSFPVCRADLLYPNLLKTSSHPPLSLALEAEAWVVPSSRSPSLDPTPPVTASTASSFDAGQTTVVLLRPLNPLHSYSVQVGILFPFMPRLDTFSSKVLPSVTLALLPSPLTVAAEFPLNQSLGYAPLSPVLHNWSDCLRAGRTSTGTAVLPRPVDPKFHIVL